VIGIGILAVALEWFYIRRQANLQQYQPQPTKGKSTTVQSNAAYRELESVDTGKDVPYQEFED
jgi:hypothetical protein